jgi:hypothetical protein
MNLGAHLFEHELEVVSLLPGTSPFRAARRRMLSSIAVEAIV